MESVTEEEFESFKTLVFSRLSELEELEELILDTNSEMEKRISDLECKMSEILSPFRPSQREQTKVEYDGNWPNMCSGTLKIWVNDEVIYEKKGVCESTGTCAFKNGKSKITKGRLVWRESEARGWPALQTAVEEELRKYEVCCGGCL